MHCSWNPQQPGCIQHVRLPAAPVGRAAGGGVPRYHVPQTVAYGMGGGMLQRANLHNLNTH